MAMRYFFTAMGVLIVWRSFSWLMKDRRLKHRRLRQLPDAGTIGILTVEQGGKHLAEGAIIPVPHEGVLGSIRTCDMVIPVDGVATTHLDFTFQDGKGLFIYPRRGCEVTVDGMALASRRDSRAYPMQHGSVLEIGQVSLRLGVFAGLKVPEVQMSASVPEMPAVPDMLPGEPPMYMPPSTSQGIPVPPGYPPPGQQPWYPPAPQGQPFMPPMNAPHGSADNANDPWQGGDGDAR